MFASKMYYTQSCYAGLKPHEPTKMKTTIQKCTNDWTAGYFAEDGINHYVTHAKTQKELMHKLIEMVVNQNIVLQPISEKINKMEVKTNDKNKKIQGNANKRQNLCRGIFLEISEG